MRESLYVETPMQAVAVWAFYRRDGVEVACHLGPQSLVRLSPLKGLEIPHAVALFVEETPGYAAVESSLRASNGLEKPFREYGGVSVTLEEFESSLALGLPREFRPPHEEFCEAEFEEMARELEASALAGIEKKYQSRYPGLIRGGFSEGWTHGD